MTNKMFRQPVVTCLALLGLALATFVGGCSDGFAFGQTEKKPLTQDERMEWWREARFGLFVHWGLYSVPAGTYKGKRIDGIGEWIMSNAQIPVTEYEKYAAAFDPIAFDADEWVRLV